MVIDRPPDGRARARQQVVVGRYMLCDEIASGGMATVHIGRLLGPVGFARTVAIKRLHPQYAKDPDFSAMFLDEARIAARVRHPNVVPTVDIVVLDDEMLVVMEYVHGEPLSRLVRACRARTGRGVPPPIALTVIAGALYGLHAAHEARDDHGAPLDIVHRDVSPQNILLGQDGVPRVVDFGVAKATGRMQNTREGTLKGKLAYMSPEQIGAHPVDRRTDIYAASVVLWEMLTGQRLFAQDSDVRVLNAVLNTQIGPPSGVAPEISPAIDALVLKGLSRDPSQRFATAAEMAEAAQQIAFATPGQISTWVKELGGDALAQRAARVVEIESTSSMVGPARASIADVYARTDTQQRVAPVPVTASMHAPQQAPVSAVSNTAAPPSDAPGSQVSSVNVAATMPPRSRAPLVIAALAPVVVATLLGTGLLFWRRHRAAEARERAAASATNDAPPPMREPTSSPVIEPVPSAIPVASSTAKNADAPAQPAPESTASSAPSPASSAQAKPAATAKTMKQPNCNPPYRIDARGVRVPKMECL